MSQLTFRRILTTDKEYRDVFLLREEILRKPIGLSLHNEDLSREINDHILIAEEDGYLCGCLILTPKNPATVQLRQMAIAEGQQGKGIGRQLVSYAEHYAPQQGYKHVILHARMVAKGFYEKLGYVPIGDVFTEVGIPHIAMEKQIS